MQSSDKALRLITEKFINHPNRLKHTLGVAKMAKYLAQIYNIDINKALTASYMHDYSKYDSIIDAHLYLSKEDLEECEKYPFLYHAYLSAEAYLKLIGNDMEIYNAIKYHVFGRLNMTKLEEIIMISDYTEENRSYNDCIECRRILLDGKFDLAIYESLKRTINYVDVPHPIQLKLLEEYKRKVI